MILEAQKFITKELKEITPEVFHRYNYKQKVRYPYITFSIGYTPESLARKTYTILLNLFDYDTSPKNVLKLEDQINKRFDHSSYRGEKFNARTRVVRSIEINTQDYKIIRKDIEIQMKFDEKER